MIKKLLLQAIKFYQIHISPMIGPVCKYHPSCSNYAVEAIQVHGAFKGSLLASCRIVRCNPFAKGRVDPVPKKKPRKSF